MINKYLINEMEKIRRDNMNCKPYEHNWVHQETTLSRIMPPVGEAIDKFPETRTATLLSLLPSHPRSAPGLRHLAARCA